MSQERNAIIVDNDKYWRETYLEILLQEGYQVVEFTSEGSALKHLKKYRPNVAVVHFKQDVPRSLRFIEDCAKLDSSMSILYSTFYTEPNLHRSALRRGAFAVVHKREDRAEFGRLLDRALKQSIARRQHEEGGPNVFVLMPFAKRFNERYVLGIKEPLEGIGVSCERVDQIGFTGDIVDKLFACIREASMIVADMTGKNPNVFYEVGYAHALGKSVILLTEKVEDIPFDLHNQRHIVYGRSVMRLREELLKTVRELLATKAPTGRRRATFLDKSALPGRQ